LGLVVTACVAGGIALPAVAAEPSPENEPEDIIVTGERVPRTLRDTASSVDVSNEERIESLSGADRIEQILEMVPNVQLGSGGHGPAIRGQDTTGVLRDLPAFLGGTRPRTTLQVDGRAVSFNEFVFGIAPLWDIERVEVFRTPQTTTQGRNSIAGAIFVHSADPTYDWRARGRLIAGNYDLRQASAMVSGPIVDGQLAFRAAADIRRGRPSSHTIDVMRDATPNKERYDLLRLKLLGEPAFWIGSRIELTYVHSEARSPPEGIRPPYKERRDPVDLVGVFGTNVDSLTLVADYRLAESLKASTTVAYGDTFVQRFSFPGFGETKTWINDLSFETAIDWNPVGPNRVIGGLSYLTTRLDQHIDLSLGAGIGDFDDKQSSLGLFGEASFEILPRTTVTAGLRYQEDRQARVGQLGRPDLMVALDYDGRFSSWLPKLSIAYDFMDGTRAGVLVQRAYNPGGATLRFDTGLPEFFEAETLWNYEAFVRATPLPSLRLSANLFYTDIRDAQRARTVSFRPPGSPSIQFASISNAPRARSYGLELSAGWRASDRFEALAAIGLLDTKITRTEDPEDPASGKDFQRSPGLTASASVDWKPTEAVRLSAQIRHNSPYFSDDFETRGTRVGQVTLVDVRGAWTTGRVTVFGYVRNLFDAFELRYLASEAGFANAVDPRELGIGIETRL
jgi:outer membrane receptor protein involved in Fe transport